MMTELGNDINIEELKKLLEHVLKNSYRARDSDGHGEAMLNTCLRLFGKDYKYSLISNSNGELCSHYPTKVVILEYELHDACRTFDNVESLYDLNHLQDLFNKARFARCRGRFACPVILYEGKHICRSATISGGVEIYGRSGFDLFFTGGESIPIPEGAATPESSNEWQLFNRIRGQDIKLLKTFGISHICDLMLEKKKVKFGMNVTSSEKVDKENRYSEFQIMSVPYPGCEFFRDWRDNGYMAEGMHFDWNQGHVDAGLELPSHRLLPPNNIDWCNYRHWDLVKLTQNYLTLLLHYMRENDSGVLVHCISGWDRTPLFVSLLRLSLWADGLCHRNLSPAEIIYLTIAYDWYLFGHNFPDRIAKGEEIFFFCFNFLRYITSEDFSSVKKRRGSRQINRTESECNIDGVLLAYTMTADALATVGASASADPELQRASYRGSNTSISSCSSLNSTKSSVDNAPMYFTAGASVEEEPVMPNGNSNHNSHCHRASPVMRQIAENVPSNVKVTQHQFTLASSTSPMAVPHPNVHRASFQDNRANSPGCGSWQFISTTGSLRGSTSSHDSPRSSSSEQQMSGENGTDSTENGTSRKQKLDAARRIFLSVYSSLLDFRNGQDAGGITGLLDHFAEKVGFRAARSTPV